jgi:hypothetical protein
MVYRKMSSIFLSAVLTAFAASAREWNGEPATAAAARRLWLHGLIPKKGVIF